MSSFQFTRGPDNPDYLEYFLSGEYVEQDLVDLAHSIKQDLQQTGQVRILLDASQLVTLNSTLIRYRLGILVGKLFGSTIKLAAITPPGHHDDLWETVARNRGAMVMAHDDREALLEWLLQDN